MTDPGFRLEHINVHQKNPYHEYIKLGVGLLPWGQIYSNPAKDYKALWLQ